MTTPTPLVSPPSRSSRQRPVVRHVASRLASLVALWESLQVELHGFYSVQRTQAFDEYRQTTSLTRVIFVLLATPLPCLAAVALADCIPLEHPNKGLRHSSGFWVRASLATWIYTYSTLEQLRHFVPQLPVTGLTTLALSVPTVAATIAVTFLLAWWIGYPVPFTVSILSFPWSFFLFSSMWLLLRHFFRQNPSSQRHVWQFVLVVACQMSLLVIYPAYNAVFFKLSSVTQTLFALLLPVIKLAEKNLISFILRRMDDLKPELIIFNVEIFNALFIACCMQNANSIATNITLIAVDFVSACISLRDLDHMLLEVDHLAMKLNIDKSQMLETALAISQQNPRLERRVSLQIIDEWRLSRQSSVAATRDQAAATTSSVSFARVSRLFVRRTYPTDTTRSPRVQKRVSNGSHEYSPVIPFEELTLRNSREGPLHHSLPIVHTATQLTAVVFPDKAKQVSPEKLLIVPQPTAPSLRPATSIASLMDDNERFVFLKKTLQTLHLTEYLLLVEYTEVMIPIVYSLYLVVLFHLPNRAYYPQLKHMDEQRLRQTIANVMMNATCEFISLVLLTYVLYRKRQPSPLRQLAFVLDRQWRMVQSKVVLWVVVTLQSTLYHLGADYSFKFAWLHSHTS